MTVVRKPEKEGVDLLAPDGLQAAICCDEEDLGEVFNETYGKMQHKLKLHFLLAETIPSRFKHPHTGEPIEVPEELVGRPFGLSKRYTASLSEKSNLRHDLKTWRGKDFTAAELEGFETERLVGVPCVLSIVHGYSERHQKWFANIEGISKLPAGWDVPTIPADYKRRKDRDGDGQPYTTNPGKSTVVSAPAEDSYGYGPDVSGDPIPDSVANSWEPDDDLPF